MGRALPWEGPYLRELSTPVIGAPARRLVPKCKGSSEANASWSLSFRGRKRGRGRRYVSHVPKRRLSRNGGDGSIEDDEAENICRIVRVKLTFVFGCVREPWNGGLETITLPD